MKKSTSAMLFENAMGKYGVPVSMKSLCEQQNMTAAQQPVKPGQAAPAPMTPNKAAPTATTPKPTAAPTSTPQNPAAPAAPSQKTASQMALTSATADTQIAPGVKIPKGSTAIVTPGDLNGNVDVVVDGKTYRVPDANLKQGLKAGSLTVVEESRAESLAKKLGKLGF